MSSESRNKANPDDLRPAAPGTSGRENILLVGFMGVGKTSVGRVLSRQSGLHFIDLDREIEARMGKTIPEIFAAEGEEVFRETESDELGHIEPFSSLVVSCGGGIVTRSFNRRLLRELGYVVWLNADEETIFSRISRGTHRPLLHTPDPRRTISELLASRLEFYSEVAHMRIDTSDLDHAAVANRIIEGQKDRKLTA